MAHGSGSKPVTSKLLHRAREAAWPLEVACRNFQVPVAHVRGSPRDSDSSEATLLVAGRLPQVNYLPGRFFKAWHRSEIATFPLWQLREALSERRASADLIVARVDRLSSRAMFRGNWLRVPDWVGCSAPSSDPEKLARGSHSLKQDLRVAARNGMTSTITNSPSDFDAFYQSMYLPYVNGRYGELTSARSEAELREIFESGGILWVHHGDRREAGALFGVEGKTLQFAALAAADETRTTARLGSMSAAYAHLMSHALRLGCTRMGMGNCRPSPEDGILRYKLKWGAGLNRRQRPSFVLHIGWDHLSAAALAFLAANPLFFYDHDGLSALRVILGPAPATPPQIQAAHRATWVPGMRRLYLACAAGFERALYVPPRTVVLDASELDRCGPSLLHCPRQP